MRCTTVQGIGLLIAYLSVYILFLIKFYNLQKKIPDKEISITMYFHLQSTNYVVSLPYQTTFYHNSLSPHQGGFNKISTFQIDIKYILVHLLKKFKQ